jgi:hypothetical protein
MILSLDRGPYQQDYFICLRTSVSEAAFLRRGKVRARTYAGSLLEDLYHQIFHQSLELKSDYIKYYAVEYATFAEYLHKRLLVPWQISHDLNDQFQKNAQIIHFHASHCFLYEDYGFEFLQKLLEQRRIK